MLRTKKGNLLDAEEDAVVHGCNCKKTMGSGVALALRNKWPEVYQADVDYDEFAGREKIGKFSWVDIMRGGERVKTVYNLYTQVNYLPRGVDHFEYEGFRTGLNSLLTHMASINLNSLAMPKIGAGLAGGNWRDIKKIIKEVLDNHQGMVITIYEL